MFAKFSRVFRRFRKFFDVFALARTCWDLFGCARIHSDAFGCIRMRPDAFGHVRKISEILCEKIRFFTFLLVFWGHTQKRTSPAASLTFFALDRLILSSVRPLELILAWGTVLGWPLRALLAGSKGPLQATLAFISGVVDDHLPTNIKRKNKQKIKHKN